MQDTKRTDPGRPVPTDPYERANLGKIEPASFRIDWTEDRRQDWPTVTTWPEIETQITEIRSRAPKGGAYTKVGFVIEFADGHTYTGRMDVSRKHETLRDHVTHFVRFSANLARPPHMSEESYRGYMAAVGQETEAMFYFVARDYAVGVETPEDHIGRANRAGKGRGDRVRRNDTSADRAEVGRVLSVELEESPDGNYYPVLYVEWQANADAGRLAYRSHVYPVGVDAAPEAKPAPVSPVEPTFTVTPGETLRLEVTESGRRQIEKLQAEVDEREGRDPTLAADVLAFLQFVEEATPNGGIQVEARKLAERVRQSPDNTL